MASDVGVLAPRWFTFPLANKLSGAAYHNNAATGAALMSGAKLFVFNGAAWECVGAQTA